MLTSPRAGRTRHWHRPDPAEPRDPAVPRASQDSAFGGEEWTAVVAMDLEEVQQTGWCTSICARPKSCLSDNGMLLSEGADGICGEFQVF